MTCDRHLTTAHHTAMNQPLIRQLILITHGVDPTRVDPESAPNFSALVGSTPLRRLERTECVDVAIELAGGTLVDELRTIGASVDRRALRALGANSPTAAASLVASRANGPALVTFVEFNAPMDAAMASTSRFGGKSFTAALMESDAALGQVVQTIREQGEEPEVTWIAVTASVDVNETVPVAHLLKRHLPWTSRRQVNYSMHPELLRVSTHNPNIEGRVRDVLSAAPFNTYGEMVAVDDDRNRGVASGEVLFVPHAGIAFGTSEVSMRNSFAPTPNGDGYVLRTQGTQLSARAKSRAQVTDEITPAGVAAHILMRAASQLENAAPTSTVQGMSVDDVPAPVVKSQTPVEADVETPIPSVRDRAS